MNKITTEFQDGQILHAADLNQLITSINQAADELATKAGQQDLDNTKRTANNALTEANNAATVAATAQTSATNAETSATTAAGQAAQALATAQRAEGLVSAVAMGNVQKVTTPDIVQTDTTLYIFQGNQAMTVRLPTTRVAQLLVIKNLSDYNLTINTTGAHIYSSTSVTAASSVVIQPAKTLNLICAVDQTWQTVDYFQF